MTLRSRVIPNLIQGVSQQAAQQRRDAQCEEQYDCINSPKSGAVARNGAELLKFHTGLDLTGAFTYELSRGQDEHYLLTVKGGVLRIYDLATGIACAVANSNAALFAVDGGDPSRNFVAQTVDDYTFIASKTIKPAMTSAVAASRPKEVLVFFKAGAYLLTYIVTVRYAGNTYRYSYLTPDNSAATNTRYIYTNQVAANFYDAMTGGSGGGGGASGTNNYGVGQGLSPGIGAGAMGTPGTGLTALGFGVAINGNLLRIWRDDGVDFTVDTSDGVGDTYLTSFKETARSFTELPKGGFEGFVLRIKGVQGEVSSDYWVEYVNKTAASGFWQERAAPGAHTTLDPATMPYAIVNTGPGAFSVQANTWSTRIAGDGVDSAKDPGFVGKNLKDLFYHESRLGIMTEGTMDWSKSRNVFTFFPDTVQTVLADAPIGITLSAAGTVALLRRVSQVDEALYAWAQKVQFRINSGNDPFRQNTIAAPPSTAYEFAEDANFARVATSLYFATEPDEYATIRNLVYNQGRTQGDTDVTAHVSELIPAGVRRLEVSDTGQMLFVFSDGAPSKLYLYNYLVQDRTVVQSAWNVWHLPTGTLLWAGLDGLTLYLALQRADGLAFLTVPLSMAAEDPGGAYRTRMDLRVDEGDCALVYNTVADTTAITLPLQLGGALPADVLVAIRTTGSVAPNLLARGRLFEVVSVAGAVVTVRGDIRPYQFYAGLRIRSERVESPFYLRSEQGLVPTDRLNVREWRVNHDRTGYYRIDIEQAAGNAKREELKTLVLGTSDSALGVPPPLAKGTLKIACDTLAENLVVRLVNDSHLPSRWQTAEVIYEAVVRAGAPQAKAAA